MYQQQTLFEQTGAQLRDEGIEAAVSHADRVNPNWSADAYNFLLQYVKANKPRYFMCEDIRNAAEAAGLPVPPSRTAWGHLVKRAMKEGVIKSIGHDHVKNPKAHATWGLVYTTK